VLGYFGRLELVGLAIAIGDCDILRCIGDCDFLQDKDFGRDFSYDFDCTQRLRLATAISEYR
jgi:hypothetical protein